MRGKEHELRKHLQAMTKVEDVSKHTTLLAAIGETYPNSVKPIHSESPIERYTCAMHALGLLENRAYECIAQFGMGRTYAGKDFVHWLIATKQLEETATPVPGDTIVYFDVGEFKHIGKCIAGGRVCSKWGIGLLYNHAVDEVPSSYGDEVKFYKGASKEVFLSAFVTFAPESGVPAEFIGHCLQQA